MYSSFTILNIMLKRFFTLFSVRPGRRFLISDHLLPKLSLVSRSKISSSIIKGSFFISGFKKFTHLSLHYLPLRETFKILLSRLANEFHYLVPFSQISLINSSSSRLFQLLFETVVFLS